MLSIPLACSPLTVTGSWNQRLLWACWARKLFKEPHGCRNCLGFRKLRLRRVSGLWAHALQPCQMQTPRVGGGWAMGVSRPLVELLLYLWTTSTSVLGQRTLYSLGTQVACGNSTSKPTMVEVEYPLSYFGTNSSPCCQAQQNGRGKGSVLLHLWMVCLINSRAKNFDGLGKFMPSLCVLWMFCS